MTCINDKPLFIYTLAACVNLLPWLLVNLKPSSAIISIILSFNMGIIVLGFLTANIPDINLNNVASSFPILFAFCLLIFTGVKFFSMLIIFFGVMSVFGSAVVINKQDVEAAFEASLGIELNDPGFYCLVGTVILLCFFGYYLVATNYLIAFGVQTGIYSFLVTISIHWLYEAAANNYVVCCDANSDNNPTAIRSCPLWFWWWWWFILIVITLTRIMLYYFYEQHLEQKRIKHYKKLEEKNHKPRRRYAGMDLQSERLIY